MRIFINFSNPTDDKAEWEKCLMVPKNRDERRQKEENVKRHSLAVLWIPGPSIRHRQGGPGRPALWNQDKAKQTSQPMWFCSPSSPPAWRVTDKLRTQVTLLLCGLQLPKLFFWSLEGTQARENHQSLTLAWEGNFRHQRARSLPGEHSNAVTFWTQALWAVTLSTPAQRTGCPVSPSVPHLCLCLGTPCFLNPQTSLNSAFGKADLSLLSYLHVGINSLLQTLKPSVICKLCRELGQ